MKIGLIPEMTGEDAITRMLGETGPSWATDIRTHGDRVKAAYMPLHAAAPKDGVSITRNLAYGEHDRHVLDVYQPANAAIAPVVVFVHGGAFVRGQKDISEEMYANVLIWFARQGYVAVNMEYRLAPDAPFPAGADDVALACAWISREIHAYGGDKTRVCLLGHSAGGTHAASYAFDPGLGYLGKDIACLVLVSARLRADVLPENPNAHGVRAYFGDDERAYEAMSPVTYGAVSDIPTFIVNAEYENPLLDVYGLELAYRMSVAKRRAPRYLMLPKHNHVSIMAHFNTGEQMLGEAIIDFFSECI